MNLFVRAWHAGQPSRIHAVRGMLETLANALPRLWPDYLIFALDGGHAQRARLYPQYKAGRPPKPEGMLEQIEIALQAFDVLGWPSVRILDWEADDVLASFAEQLKATAQVVLLTSDKDAIQCQARSGARIYQPWGAGQVISAEIIVDKYKVTPAQFADFLALTGDSTDGIPGVEKVGPGTAAKLLAQYGNLDNVLEAARVLHVTGAAGKNLRDQADLARLSRQLVELNAELPVGDHWRGWPISNPRQGWLEGLRDLGFGSVAKKLQEVLPIGCDYGQACTHLEIEYAGVIESFAGLAVTSQVPATSPGRCEAAEPCAGAIPSVSELVVCPGATAIDFFAIDRNRRLARRVYDEAAAARRECGKPAASSYFPGTLMRFAWDAGSDGLPFESIDLAAFDHFGKPLAVSSAPTSATAKPKTLFEE